MDFTAEAATVRINHNSRLWKWCSGILATLLVAAVIALVRGRMDTIRQIEHLRTVQVLMDKELKELKAGPVNDHTQWIADWYAVLKVPEREG